VGKDLDFEIKSFRLELKSPFKIAHGVSLHRDTVVVVIKYRGVSGLGEAPVVPYYVSDKYVSDKDPPATSLVGEIEEFLEELVLDRVIGVLTEEWRRWKIRDRLEILDGFFENLGIGRLSGFSRCAVTTALLDVSSRVLGKSFGEYVGVNFEDGRVRRGFEVVTSLTVAERDVEGIVGSIEKLYRMEKEGAGKGRLRSVKKPLVKLKLGFDSDVEVLTEALLSLRERFRVDRIFRFSVDVNQGWSGCGFGDLCKKFLGLYRLLGEGFEIEFVEEPVDWGMAKIEEFWAEFEGEHAGGFPHEKSIPVFLDESVKSFAEVESLSCMARAGNLDVIGGIVAKLGKFGGPVSTLRAVRLAKQVGLRVMMGCFIESNVGIAAAAYLSRECDYVDLDSPFLVKNKPAVGLESFQVVNETGAVLGVLSLPQGPGLGVRI